MGEGGGHYIDSAPLSNDVLGITRRLVYSLYKMVPETNGQYWLFKFPFELHCGWIIAASFVNFSVLFVAYGADDNYATQVREEVGELCSKVTTPGLTLSCCSSARSSRSQSCPSPASLPSPSTFSSSSLSP